MKITEFKLTELKSACKSAGAKGYSALSKAELIGFIAASPQWREILAALPRPATFTDAEAIAERSIEEGEEAPPAPGEEVDETLKKHFETAALEWLADKFGVPTPGEEVEQDPIGIPSEFMDEKKSSIEETAGEEIEGVAEAASPSNSSGMEETASIEVKGEGAIVNPHWEFSNEMTGIWKFKRREKEEIVDFSVEAFREDGGHLLLKAFVDYSKYREFLKEDRGLIWQKSIENSARWIFDHREGSEGDAIAPAPGEEARKAAAVPALYAAIAEGEAVAEEIQAWQKSEWIQRIRSLSSRLGAEAEGVTQKVTGKGLTFCSVAELQNVFGRLAQLSQLVGTDDSEPIPDEELSEDEREANAFGAKFVDDFLEGDGAIADSPCPNCGGTGLCGGLEDGCECMGDCPSKGLCHECMDDGEETEVENQQAISPENPPLFPPLWGELAEFEISAPAGGMTLSVRQPWAWAIFFAEKDIENRTWTTDHRGPLWIHASKTYDHEGAKWLSRRLDEPIPGPKDLPMGAVVGRVDLVDCTTTIPVREDGSDNWWAIPEQVYWKIENARSCVPVPYKGKLSLFQFELESDAPQPPPQHLRDRSRAIFDVETPNGSSFVPSSGTTGDIWESIWCEKCRHFTDSGCRIYIEALAGESPAEWRYWDNKPLCTGFEEGMPEEPIAPPMSPEASTACPVFYPGDIVRRFIEPYIVVGPDKERPGNWLVRSQDFPEAGEFSLNLLWNHLVTPSKAYQFPKEPQSQFSLWNLAVHHAHKIRLMDGWDNRDIAARLQNAGFQFANRIWDFCEFESYEKLSHIPQVSSSQ